MLGTQQREEPTMLALGTLTVLASGFLFGVVILDPDDDNFPAGRLVVGLGGAILALTGVALILRATRLPEVVTELTAVVVIALFSAVLLILAISNAPSGGGIPFLPREWNQQLGRLVAGAFGLVLVGVVFLVSAQVIRTLRERPEARADRGAAAPTSRAAQARLELEPPRTEEEDRKRG